MIVEAIIRYMLYMLTHYMIFRRSLTLWQGDWVPCCLKALMRVCLARPPQPYRTHLYGTTSCPVKRGYVSKEDRSGLGPFVQQADLYCEGNHDLGTWNIDHTSPC